MEREIMPDHAAEEFYRYLIPPDAFMGSERPKKKINHCILFCKKMSPNVFNISKGVAVVEGAETCSNDGICMIAPSTKVVFVFEKS